MKENYLSFQSKFLIIILIPMVLLISYLYFDRKQSYESYIRNTEAIIAQLLLEEEEFIFERLNSAPLILNQDRDKITKQLNNNNQYDDLENILSKFVINRLDLGAIGIYSNDKDKIVFHLGSEDIYKKINASYVSDLQKSKTDSFYININNKIIYIVPISDGYIYTFHENIENKPNTYIFIGILILTLLIALIATKWVEVKTQLRIKSLQDELMMLRNTGKLLPVNNDQFDEIAKSVNELQVHLSNKHEFLHKILDSLPLAIIYYDQNGKVLYVNETTEKITGYTKNEIENFTLSKSLLNNTDNLFWETLRSGHSFLGFESYCPTKSGKEIPVITSTITIEDSSNNNIGTISSFIDISEQDRLRKIEKNAKVMLDHISDGVMMVDNNGVITGFNYGAEEMTGLKAEQVLGKKYDDIFIKRKTIFTKLTQTLETKEEYTNYKKKTVTEDGRTVYLMITTKILWDENERQIGAMGIYKDISNLEELSQQVQRADKLAVVGELAAGTAHEIRNPLTTIMGFIQLLKNDLNEPKKEEYVNLVLKEINHINEIIREMLLLSKPATPSKLPVDINQTIIDIISFMNSEAILHNVELAIDIQENIPKVEIDERQIKQVFINLIRNGIQAMENGGKINILSRYQLDSKYVEILFIDQGIGIPKEQIMKIYEPFYTTKADGTGLGIPVSYRIMKSHGGEMQISSTLGEGTEVKLLIPLIMDES